MRPLIFLCLGLLLSLSALSAQSFDRAKMDSLLRHVETNYKSMGSLAIIQDGELVYKQAIGYANVEEETKAMPNTRYGIGSISKTFTAVLTLQLAEEGKLSLDQTIDQYFPSLPNAEQITIKQLLQHRSGLHNFTDDVDYTTMMEQEASEEDLLKLFIEKGVDFDPDEKMSYSNTGYVVLSFILEKASGKSYADLLEAKIAKVCGLESTYMPDHVVGKEGKEALSYQRSGQAWSEATKTHPSIPTGAGAIISTAQDLAQFFHCLFSGELISDTHLKEMKKMVDGYGYGLFSFPFHEQTAYGHTGGIDGFTSMAGYFPEEKMGIVYLSNGAVMSNNDLMIGALSIYYGKPYEFPEFKKTITVEAAQLKQYEGNYVSEGFPLDIKIFLEGEVLMGQATGQGAFPLEPFAEHQFQFEPAKLEIEFKPAEGKLILKQGAEYEFTKEQ
jgi:CubicO group peptidase (beta-lactamase class C family)